MTIKNTQFKYILSDILAAFVVWVLFMMFRRTVNDAHFNELARIFVPNYDFVNGLFIFPTVCLFVHYLTGFYLYVGNKLKVNPFPTTLVASIIISIGIFFSLLIDDIVVSYEYYYYSLLVLFVLLFSFTYLFRLIVYKTLKRKHRAKQLNINTIIIGTGKNAMQIAKNLQRETDEYNFVGFVAIDNNIHIDREMHLGSLQNIEQIIKDNKVRDAVIALEDYSEQRIFKIINQLYVHNIDIRFTPSLYEILTGGSRIKMFGTLPLVDITKLNVDFWQLSIKRFIDIVASAVSLLLLLPLFAFFAVRIKLDSKGPVFFRQERIGYLGRSFKILKFRTMFVDAENGVPKLSSPDDDRITKVGRVLRKYRLDELPQFWNVLVGQMSLVGPRPERLFYIRQITEHAPYYCLIYKVRPGLTSWGPIKIGYSDTLEKMIERLNYDIIYVENMSLINDFKILLLTAEVLIKGKGI